MTSIAENFTSNSVLIQNLGDGYDLNTLSDLNFDACVRAMAAMWVNGNPQQQASGVTPHDFEVIPRDHGFAEPQ